MTSTPPDDLLRLANRPAIGRLPEAGSAGGRVKSVLLAGVGGQGILLASNILARAALLSGRDVKTNEVHGMAQRGGSVVAEIRFGPKVHSPLIAPGGADVLAALEETEALRYASYLAPGGLAVVSTLRLIPTSVSSGLAKYPPDLEEKLRQSFRRLKFVDAAAAAERTGGSKTLNLVILGAVSPGLDFEEAVWLEAIELCVKPKFLDPNLKAFGLGRRLTD
ncbi:MAG: indolepyruvate oxidoreductase subunit beta [Planctomycetota bacterium]|jgi:indolepyruvate ferredoxin oxidoreductase beta subunit|nr:indolepyruvate oxidoreductase subunit beta [Planctomycetota bacterium]